MTESEREELTRLVLSTTFRVVVLGTAVYIALRTTAKPHADPAAISLVIFFTSIAFGYTVESIAKFFGRGG